MTSTKNKIVPRETLNERLAPHRRAGEAIGLTNGVFDIMHAGHVNYLEEAKALCDVLVISLNTDASVREYKGPARPLLPLEDRQRVAASLSCIDFVTSHGERRMRTTIELLKPDLYLKGGDYTVSQLTSREVVESYGGQVKVLPLTKGRSTTSIIKKAYTTACLEGISLHHEQGRKPSAFLDRDGVVIQHVSHVHDPGKVNLTKNAAAGLLHLREKGYRLVLVTNQPGIGMGYFTMEDFFKVNSRMLSLLSREGVLLDAVYFCPHSPAAGCSCRKPATELLERAVKEQALIREKSIFFGDREVDMQTARNFGIPGILVGKGDTEKARELAAFQGNDLLAAAQKIK